MSFTWCFMGQTLGMFGFDNIHFGKCPPTQHNLFKEQKNHCLNIIFVNMDDWFESNMMGMVSKPLSMQCKLMHTTRNVVHVLNCRTMCLKCWNSIGWMHGRVVHFWCHNGYLFKVHYGCFHRTMYTKRSHNLTIFTAIFFLCAFLDICKDFVIKLCNYRWIAS
jgi:hypothetical protein